MFFCISYLLYQHRTTNQLLTSLQVISQKYKYTRLSSQNFQDLRFFLLFLYPHGRVLMHSLFWEAVLDMKVIYVRYVDWLKRSMWSCKLEGNLMSLHLYLQTFYNVEQKKLLTFFLYFWTFGYWRILYEFYLETKYFIIKTISYPILWIYL